MHQPKGQHRMRIFGRPWRAAAAVSVLVAGAGIGATTVASAAVAPGARTISAAAASTTLRLGSSSGLPDQPVGFTGSGYRAKEPVAVHWRSASGTELAKITASKTGTISGSFRVPLPKAGVAARVTVVAVGAKSKHEGKATFTQSCGDEWTSLKGGNWSDAPDWSRGAVPGSTMNACITLTGATSYTVVLNQLTGSTTVGSLRVGAAGGKTTQTLEMNPSGSDQYLTLARTSTIAAHGVFRLTSAGGGSDFIQGPGTLDNHGLLSTITGKGWSRYLYGNIVNEPGGTFSVAAGGGGCTCQSSGSTFVNKGTLDVARGSEYQVFQASFAQSGGHVANGGIVSIDAGTLTKSAGTSTGNAWQLFNGAVLHDKPGSGSGSYTFYDSGTLSGTIPAGQTVTLDGNGSNDVRLALAGNVTNDGTLVMTSGAIGLEGGGNAWLVPLSGTPTLYNDGTIRTLNGVGWTRYFSVDVVNEAEGTMNLDAGSNWLVGGATMTSDGTLNVGAGAILKLVGTSYGDANLIEGSTATTGIVLDGPQTSDIDQYACSAAGCRTDVIDLAGTLSITAIGTPAGSYIPIHSEFSAITKGFAASTAHYRVTYNQPDVAVTGVVGDVEITPVP